MANLSATEYAKLALTIVALDRELATQLVAAIAKQKPVRRKTVLLEAAIRDALRDTTVDADTASAARLVRQAKPPA